MITLGQNILNRFTDNGIQDTNTRSLQPLDFLSESTAILIVSIAPTHCRQTHSAWPARPLRGFVLAKSRGFFNIPDHSGAVT